MMTASVDMAEDKAPRYYRVRKGRAYWEPGRFGKHYGFPMSHALGADGADAKGKALKWNEELDEARAGRPPAYPDGSLGRFYFGVFKGSDAWALMEPATQALYERAWPEIDKRFGKTVLTEIRAIDSERFHTDIHPRHENKRDPRGKLKLSWHKAHMVLKHYRLLLSALVDYGLLPAPAPVGRVSNPSPPSRAAVWTYEEVQALIAGAVAIDELGMALGILIGWETMLSTVDVRLLPAGAWKPPRPGEEAGTFETARRKSKKAVRVASTPELDTAIRFYLATLRAAGIEPRPDEPLLRRGKRSIAFKDRHAFKDVFADVRAHAFPGDDRQFGDMRRSGATEAKFGGADDKDLGKTMANRLDQDEGLQSTYNVGASKKVQDARKAGRSQHSAKFRKSES